jgi:hypothetical protein
MDNDETDLDDESFTASSTEDGSDSNSGVIEISNEEVRKHPVLISVPTTLTLFRWPICCPQKLYRRLTESDRHAC